MCKITLTLLLSRCIVASMRPTVASLNFYAIVSWFKYLLPVE